MVTGLKVSKNVHGEGIRWLNLLATYTREALAADVEEVLTQEKAKKWKHLKIIADKLPTETNMEIGLLIGANCSKALEPEELPPSKNGGPFFFRTLIRMVCSWDINQVRKENFDLLQSNCCTRCSYRKNSIQSFWYIQ